MAPLPFSHSSANWRSARRRTRRAAGVVGTRSTGDPEVRLLADGVQVTGLLRPTPLGSNETMSNRSSSSGVSTDSSLGRSSIPDAPGPPGLITSDPIRSEGTSAGWRARAICRVGPSGRL